MQTLSSTLPAACRLICYEADSIPGIWAKVEPLLKGAVDWYRGDDGPSLETVYGRLLESRFQLWTCQSDGIDAAVVTAIEGESCRLVMAGGRYLEIWVQWLPYVEEWAREHGCKQLVIDGRRGWIRAAGFEEIYTRMVRKI